MNLQVWMLSITGVDVNACCAKGIIAMGENTWEGQSYTCPLHQEGWHPHLEATSHNTLPGHKIHLKMHCLHEQVIIPVTPPRSPYSDGVIVTGHQDIQVNIQDKVADPFLLQNLHGAPSETILVSEESQEYSSHRGVPEEGEELEIGKTVYDFQQFTAVLFHNHNDLDKMILPHQRH